MSGRVVVLGSVNVDLVAHTARLPRPGETVVATHFSHLMGGKGANQAVAAARAGAQVVLCGAVGHDGFGHAARAALAEENVDVERVVSVAEPTGVAFVVVEESGENQIVVVAGANACADGRDLDWRVGDVATAVLEVPIAAVERFFSEARDAGAMTVLNAAPATADARRLIPLCDVVCVNAGERETLGELTADTAWVITLGAAGIRVVDADGELILPPHDVTVVDTVGAGDAACGALVAALAAGLTLRRAAARANAAGALAVRAVGARSAPTTLEIDQQLEVGHD